MKKLLDIYRERNKTINDSYDQIIVNIHGKRRAKGYKSFLFCGSEPGVGVTTVAINVAVSMAISGWKTVLVDADMRKEADYKRLNEETESGLSDYLSKFAERNEIFYETNWSLLSYIPSGKREESPVRQLCSNRMEQLLDELHEEYDCVILDMPAISAAADSWVMASKTDAVILVTSLGESSRTELKKAKMKLDSADANVLGVIVNKVDKQEYMRVVRNFDYFNKRKYAFKEKRES